MINYNKIIYFLLLLFFTGTFAQSTPEIRLKKVITDYFLLERETIHTQFNKNVFLTGESIWFKGYVFHRKTDKPFYSCTNIFASLMDNEGNEIENQLLYGNMGSFSGNFNLKNNLKSGRYYIRFYTNWMNNFTEDESSVYEVKIINPEEGIDTALLANEKASEIKIELNPEGGTLLENKTNTIGVNIITCNNKPLPITQVSLLDEKDKVIEVIPINELGCGKFNLFIQSDSNYKIVADINNNRFEENIPKPSPQGVILQINNVDDSFLIKIKTNESTYNTVENKPYYIFIHKDGNASFYETKFSGGKNEMEISFLKEHFFEGTNTIRLLDSELNEVAQRLIYIRPENSLNLEINKIKGETKEVAFKGNINDTSSNLSVSIVPTNNLNKAHPEDIYSDLLIAPYLQGNPKLIAKQYITSNETHISSEFDTFLINQKSKYKWTDILNNPPKENYTFDMGLTLKGTINQKLKPKKEYKVRITSMDALLDETVDVNNKNEFFLENLIVADSARINFELIGDGKVVKDIKLYPQLLKNTAQFNKKTSPYFFSCSTDSKEKKSFELPKFKSEVTLLDEVVIEQKKTELKNVSVFGNVMLRGYKITEDESRGFPTILDLIRYEGFLVRNKPDSAIAIYSPIKTTFVKNLKSSPEIYINNMRLIKHDILRDIQTCDVDEFYINKHISIPSLDNKFGIIKIYLKKFIDTKQEEDPKTVFIVKNGFKKPENFISPPYLSTSNRGFENFGVVYWLPSLLTDEKGDFNFSIPKNYYGKVDVIIEGLSREGKIIQKTETLDLNK